jgi:diketogulonate reductase-like aldo/keto reductase
MAEGPGMAGMRRVAVPGTGGTVAAVGQGTWGLGVTSALRGREIDALRLGVSLGMTLIDTAEYYGAGRTEELVGEALSGCRDQVFLVTKVWPSHAGYRALQESVDASRRRLRTDRVDAVLLHWPTRSVPLAQTLRALADLQRQGAIGCYGLSNFAGDWLDAAEGAAPEGARPAFNQVPYSLADRRVENAVLPHARAHGQVVMAWSPLGHGRMTAWRGYGQLAACAAERGATPQQLALAFLVDRPGVVAIPRAARPEHVRANAAAGAMRLTPEERARLESAFPRGRKTRFPALPPYDPFFRLILWAEERSHRRA